MGFEKERSILSEQVSNTASRLDEVMPSIRELRQEVLPHIATQLQHALAAEQKERELIDVAIREVRAMVEREAQARETGHMALSCTVAAARKAMEEVKDKRNEESHGIIDGSMETVGDQIRNEIQDMLHNDVGPMREGLTKVVEAVQQERRSRADADAKLREDCRD